MTNELIYGCPIVDEQVPSDLREAINVLSKKPLLEVKVRQEGITSGQHKRCYWNSNLCAQTWGGKVLYGWAIQTPSDIPQINSKLLNSLLKPI